ncbi:MULTISPECIES: c-type cytochrome [unclassified Halomonas]|uniref:c-type cytochrome n=1 Tax=unclassified Halomonas TaxID=2609666 RepID=UPI0007D9FCC9|nr:MULTISPECIES: c-type cytochrome [unclassified Halomonas]OAL58729.1 aldehyde oxidase [Halomonas sp. ALS9]
MSDGSMLNGQQAPAGTSALLAKARYGVVVRPPFYRWSDGRFASDRLVGVDKNSLASLSGPIDVVVEGDFVGVVADSLALATDAAKQLKVEWRTVRQAADKSPAKMPVEERHPPYASASHAYGWPSRMRWGNHPSWVIADYSDQQLRVWGQTATPVALKQDLNRLTALDVSQIELYSAVNNHSTQQASGLGRHCGDDAAVDAALMSRAVGNPVAVWLDARYAKDVEALGQAQRITLNADLSSDGEIARYRYQQANLTGEVAAVGLWLSGAAAIAELAEFPAGDNGTPPFSPYVFRDQYLAARSQPASLATNPTLIGIQQAFARESFLDEVARESEQDPIALRLRHLEDARGIELIESVAKRAEWQRSSNPSSESLSQDLLRGRGFAYSQLPDREQRVEAGVRSAWIADVEVNRITGDVQLTRLVVGQDAGPDIDTARLQQTLQARVLGEARPFLGHEPRFDEWGDGSRALTKHESSALAPTASWPTLYSPSASVAAVGEDVLTGAELSPGVAVIANALFDATGLRFRQPPFTANRVRQALEESSAEEAGRPSKPVKQSRSTKRRWLAAAAFTTIAGTAAMAWPWKGAIAPVSRPAANLYSAETIERGRLVAAAGDCAACHTSEGGVTNVGGRAFETPFGTLYSTNITPDEATGIGQWSYAAFERAMRHGISRNGSHLYPAFPYTAFAKTSDADLQALYAYLMAQPPVAAAKTTNELSFPFSVRALMAGWNTLYHDPAPFQPDPLQSELYNRGAYLAEGLGHCSACHSPRNAMGAEKSGGAYLAGAFVDGWEAPPLNTLSRAPVPWSEASLYDYLRQGESSLHGVASGPMAPVVAGLAELPEYDVRAIAHYVAAQMQAPAGNSDADVAGAEQRVASAALSAPELEAGERLFEGACAACHVASGVPTFSSASTNLALNTNLHSDHPDNVIQSILGGVHAEHVPGVGNMPGFADSFSNTQVADLATYLRARFAPEKAPWQQVEQRIADLRQPHHNNTHSTP